MLEVRTDLITCCCHAVFLLPGRLHAHSCQGRTHCHSTDGKTEGPRAGGTGLRDLWLCTRGPQGRGAAGLPRGEELLGAAPPPASHAPPAQPAAAALQS